MSAIHVLRVPSHVVRRVPDGEERWCFLCRKRTTFTLTVHAPDPMSYYGPHAVVTCDLTNHADGDCFPGTWREWGDS